MKHILCILLLCSTVAVAQKSKKTSLNPDAVIITALQSHIDFLTDDILGGSKTGTAGEKLTSDYIGKRFEEAGLLPKGENGTYKQLFEVYNGAEKKSTSSLNIDGFIMRLDKDYYPLAFSANGTVVSNSAVALSEKNAVWLWDLKEALERNKNNPEFDLKATILKKVEYAAARGATALMINNSSYIKENLNFNAETEPAKIPVLLITKDIKNKFLSKEAQPVGIKLQVTIGSRKQTGYNMVGYIDNSAKNTVVVGAHYNHSGNYRLPTGAQQPLLYKADDNASGTAVLIELGRKLKAASLKNYNYLFIAFSGDEPGLYGINYFMQHPTIDLANVTYMINLDMIGRMGETAQKLTIKGYSTSPVWATAVSTQDEYLNISFDNNSGGPGNYADFYQKNIPVLFLSTSPSSDNPKSADKTDRSNYTDEVKLLKYIYNLIASTDNKVSTEYKEKVVLTETVKPQQTEISVTQITEASVPLQTEISKSNQPAVNVTQQMEISKPKQTVISKSIQTGIKKPQLTETGKSKKPEADVIQQAEVILPQQTQIHITEQTQVRLPEQTESNLQAVSLGILPDNTFSGPGVKPGSIIKRKVADISGLIAGDVILKIGDYPTLNLKQYEQAMSKFSKGDITKLSVKRDSQDVVIYVVF